MSRIRMHVFISNESDATISNESDATLTFGRDEIASGDYTPDWSPPPVINLGQWIGFQGEGDLTMTIDSHNAAMTLAPRVGRRSS
jgi:hypothetical protein